MLLDQQSVPGDSAYFRPSYSSDESDSTIQLLNKDYESCCFIGVPEKDTDGLPEENVVAYPQEKWKTFQAFLVLLAGLFVSALALASVHDQQPLSKPLPDIVFIYFNQVNNGLELSEYVIIFVTYSTLITMVFHHHRWIIFRRMFVMAGLLYLGRGVTMFVTVLPQANLSYPCALRVNHTSFLLVTYRAVQLLSGLGLSINGKLIYCGDFIYSGHTCSLVLCCLIFAEYTPQAQLLWRISKWIIHGVSVIGICLVSISRTHYTIDILIAYFVTTVIFRIYHTTAAHPDLKTPSCSNHHNYLSRFWFFGIIRYFERNVPDGRLPMRFTWPVKRPTLPRVRSWCNSPVGWLVRKKDVDRLKLVPAG